jgi:hypothetical protein
MTGLVIETKSSSPFVRAMYRHGPPWPLPVNAPKSIFQKFDPIQGRELSGLVFSPYSRPSRRSPRPSVSTHRS